MKALPVQCYQPLRASVPDIVLQPGGQVACCAEIQQGLGQRGQSVAIKPANPSVIVLRDFPDRTLELTQNQRQAPAQTRLGVPPTAGQIPDGMAVVKLVRIAGTQLFRAEETIDVILLFA